MSYDFAAAKAALSGAFRVEGWADKKSAQLETSCLLPLEHNTLRAEELADEIGMFILTIDAEIDETVGFSENSEP